MCVGMNEKGGGSCISGDMTLEDLYFFLDFIFLLYSISMFTFLLADCEFSQ